MNGLTQYFHNGLRQRTTKNGDDAAVSATMSAFAPFEIIVYGAWFTSFQGETPNKSLTGKLKNGTLSTTYY